jgi:putative spermidine/putrescine transport system permease protein
MLVTSVRDPEMATALPRTAALLRAWDGAGLPDEATFAALGAELALAAEGQFIGGVAGRLNFERTGMRSLLLRTARAQTAAPFSMALPALDQQWADPAIWHLLRRASLGVTPLYLLRSLDFDVTANGGIQPMPADQSLFLALFTRSFAIAITVTVLCLLIGYPVAQAIAGMTRRWSQLALALVLVPFWISILVRTTAWFIVLQRDGPANGLLAWAGVIDAPLQLMFTRFAVLLAMVHVLLPFVILPLVVVMRRIDPGLLRAAASLGAPGWRQFVSVYLPLTLPGIGAGALIVFMLATGFYITPALLGGPGDQMVSASIADNVNLTLNWGMAAAISLWLLLGTLVLAGTTALAVPRRRWR